MMNQQLFSRSLSAAWAVCTVIMAVGAIRGVSTRETDCSQRDLMAVIQPTDGAYALALNLSRELGRGGFVVKCVLRSHWENSFEGLAGAALYRTDQGDFEALFLSPPESFERLSVVEHQGDGRFVYSFAGQPKPWATNRIDGARRMYFLKDAYRLLVVSGDERVVTRLLKALATRDQR